MTVTTDADRVAPSVPGGLRVTGVSASKVSLAWDASSDNTGILAYQVQTSAGALSWTGPTSVDVVGLPCALRRSMPWLGNRRSRDWAPLRIRRRSRGS